ncbi:hypothetical protein D3C85_149150 [compost metagenome]|jgi:hypothetical protein
MTDAVIDTDDASQPLLAALAFGQCSPELQSSYSRIATILNDVDFTGHIDELELLFSMVNDHNIDTCEVIPSVDAVFRVAAERCLQSIGVALDADTPLAMLEDALGTLLQFDPTDAPAVFVGIVDASEDGIEALLSILAYVGNYSEEDWFPYIVECSENTVRRIREISAKEDSRIQSQADTVDPDELNQRIARMASLRPDSLGVELARDNVGVGASLESLYGCHVERLIDLSTEQAVVELFSLAAISCESYDKLDVSISAALDDLCYEMDDRRKAEQVRLNMMKSYRPVFGIENEKI